MRNETIHLYDAANNEIHTAPVKSKAQRSSVQAAAAQKQLNGLKAEFPQTDRATITFPWRDPSTQTIKESVTYFEFVNGRSMMYYPKELNEQIFRSVQGR